MERRSVEIMKGMIRYSLRFNSCRVKCTWKALIILTCCADSKKDDHVFCKDTVSAYLNFSIWLREYIGSEGSTCKEIHAVFAKKKIA